MICTKYPQISDVSIAYVKAQEQERESIALEIHDRIIQPLTAVFHELEMLQIAQEGSANCMRLKTIISDVNYTIQETRNVIKGLYPPSLAKYHLISLMTNELKVFQEQTGCECRIDIQCDLGDISSTSEITLYRLFHEAVFNIKQHASASKVYIAIYRTGTNIKMTIEDNGKGFDIEKALQTARPSGLRSMQHRVDIVGGIFNIYSGEKGRGTKIEAEIPIC